MGRPAELPGVLNLPVVQGRCYFAGDLVPSESPHEGRASRDIAQAAHLRGKIATQPCHCCCEGKRKRRFKECVVLEGKMKGRCTNCHWAMDQRKCIFPTTFQGKEPQALAPISAPNQLRTATVPHSVPSVPSRVSAAPPKPSSIAIQQARWSDDPTIHDPELVRAALSMPPMRSNFIPRVHLWLENDWRMDGLAALDPKTEDVEIEVSRMSYSDPRFDRLYECDQMYIGAVVDWTGFQEELYIDTDDMLYRKERVARLRDKADKLEKHAAAAAALLGFVQELHLEGNNVQLREQRIEKAQMAISKMKEAVTAEEEELASCHRYIQARAVELERWYTDCDKRLGSTGVGKNKRRRILSVIEQIPFVLCTSLEEREAIGWRETTRGPSVEEENRMKRKRLAEVQSKIERRNARAEQGKGQKRRKV